MIKTFIITSGELEKSRLFSALGSESNLQLKGAPRGAADLMRSILGFLPEVILFEAEAATPESLTLIRSILSTQPVPIIVVCANAQSVDKVFKEAGAVAAISNSATEYPMVVRHIRIMRGMKIVRPRTARLPSTRTGRYLLIAASSGGPSVIRSLLKGVHPDSGLSVVLAQHLSADNLPTFRAWLGQETPWKLEVCVEPMTAQPGRVYLAKGGCHLVWKQGTLCSVPSEEALEFVPSANRLFNSFATSVASEVIAVVLSGMGDDGTEGLLKLKRAGALTLVQEPTDAKVSGMPSAAIAAGAAQRVVQESRLVSVILSHLDYKAT